VLTGSQAGTASAQSGGEGDVNPNRKSAQITHGTVMGLAFAFLFPLGAIIMRTLSFRGLVWVHAAIQIFAYILAVVGLGLGVYIAIYPDSQVISLLSHGLLRTHADTFTICSSRLVMVTRLSA